MERGRIWLLALLALLLTASAVRADTITAFLDNPPDHAGIAGIGTINGWAFATNRCSRNCLSAYRRDHPGRFHHSVL